MISKPNIDFINIGEYSTGFIQFLFYINKLFPLGYFYDDYLNSLNLFVSTQPFVKERLKPEQFSFLKQIKNEILKDNLDKYDDINLESIKSSFDYIITKLRRNE